MVAIASLRSDFYRIPLLVVLTDSTHGGGELGSATTSYPLVARMNNLLTLHS
jgi:hypothetical protein